MTFYDELKVLCKKYGLYCGVYARSVDEDNLEKHQVFVVTDKNEPNQNDIRMTMETITYFVNALFMAAKDRFYATHAILDIVSMVIKSYKDKDEDE
jgi:hypothetical protein